MTAAILAGSQELSSGLIIGPEPSVDLHVATTSQSTPHRCEPALSMILADKTRTACAAIPKHVSAVFSAALHESTIAKSLDDDCTLICRPSTVLSAQDFPADGERASGVSVGSSDDDGDEGLEGNLSSPSPWWAWVIVGVAFAATGCCCFLFITDNGDRAETCAEWCLCYRGVRSRPYPGKGLAGDGWKRMEGRGMSSVYTEWVRFVTPEEAERIVTRSDKLVGYITDAKDTSGVFLCKPGGTILTNEDGGGNIRKSRTLHLWSQEVIGGTPSDRQGLRRYLRHHDPSLQEDGSEAYSESVGGLIADVRAQALAKDLQKQKEGVAKIHQHSESNRQWPTEQSFYPLGTNSEFDQPYIQPSSWSRNPSHPWPTK